MSGCVARGVGGGDGIPIAPTQLQDARDQQDEDWQGNRELDKRLRASRVPGVSH